MKIMYRYFHPIAFNAVRFTVSSLTMLAILSRHRSDIHFDKKDLRRIIWLGFLGNTMYPFIFVIGLDRTRAGNAALLMALTPIFAFLIGVAMKKEHFSAGVLAGIILSMAGASSIVLFGTSKLADLVLWSGGLFMVYVGGFVVWIRG